MREAGLVGASHRRGGPATTRRDKDARPAPELVLDAVEMAVGERRPKAVIHHSVQGSQYTSVAFGKRCGEAGVRPSMGSVGDAYVAEAGHPGFGLGCEPAAAEQLGLEGGEEALGHGVVIEGWYNPARRHSGLGYKSPVTYEADIQAAKTHT
jgi:putative transposase